MKRVLIMGCGGAGKSTLADALSQRTGLPVIPLDGHFWTPGWVQESPERWQAKSNELTARPEWILDGNYGSTMERRLERADTAILIDRAPLLCLWRVYRRRLKWSGKVRPGLPDGCVERLSLEFVHYILTWRLLRLPGVLKRLEGARERGVAVHVLRSDAEIEAFLDSASTKPPPLSSHVRPKLARANGAERRFRPALVPLWLFRIEILRANRLLRPSRRTLRRKPKQR